MTRPSGNRVLGAGLHVNITRHATSEQLDFIFPMRSGLSGASAPDATNCTPYEPVPVPCDAPRTGCARSSARRARSAAPAKTTADRFPQLGAAVQRELDGDAFPKRSDQAALRRGGALSKRDTLSVVTLKHETVSCNQLIYLRHPCESRLVGCSVFMTQD